MSGNFFSFLKLYVTFLCFVSCHAIVLTEQSSDKTILPRLDVKRIEVKRCFYEELAKKSKKFRQTVYVLGAGATAAFLIYLILKFVKNGKEDEKSAKGQLVSSVLGDERTMPSAQNFDLVDRLTFWRKYKQELRNENVWNLCKYNFKEGLTDWVYYAPITILMTTVLGVHASIFSLIKNKFLQLWNGQDEDLFLSARKQIGLILNQFKSFFEFEEDFVEKEEIKGNCFVFIDSIENLFAFTFEKVERDLKEHSIDTNSHYSVVAAQMLLFDNIEKFCEELEQELNKTDCNYLGQESLSMLFSSFKHLNNQIARFLNLCCSVFYGNKK